MFKRLVIAVFMVMCFSGMAMAGAVATGECPADAPPDCVKMFTLNDMGTFSGDQWVWNNDFVSAHQGQLVCSDFSDPCNFQWDVVLRPTIESVPVAIENVRVDRRKYANSDNDHTRFHFVVRGESQVIYMPFLYQDDNVNSLFGAVPMPDDSFPFIEAERNELPAPTVESVVWNGHEDLTPVSYISNRHEWYSYLKYSTGARDWYLNGITENYGPAMHYKFFDEVQIGTETFDITLNNGQTYTASVDITNVDEMPKIPAFFSQTVGVNKVTKSGKQINNEHVVTTPNINVREVDTPNGMGKALVVQWAEPDGALFGNFYRNMHPEDTFMLRVYIGKAIETVGESKEIYLWVDCPVQTGTVTIGPEYYQWLVDTVQEQGLNANELDVLILYRTVTDRDGNLDSGNYHNRGLSDNILFTPTIQ